MKNSLYLFALNFLLFCTGGCHKDGISPDKKTGTKTQTCTLYGYSTKTEPVTLGPATGAEIIVGFNTVLSLNQQKQIFSRYKSYQAIASQWPTLSGQACLVTLKPGTSCFEAEAMISSLENQPEVRFSLPGLQSGTYGDEFLVALHDQAAESAFLKLVADTRTKVVIYPEELGPGLYMFSADKNAAGNVFEMVSFFNQSELVNYARPNSTGAPLTPPVLAALSITEAQN